MFSRKVKRSNTEVLDPVKPTPAEGGGENNGVQDKTDGLMGFAQKGLGISNKFVKLGQIERPALFASTPTKDEAAEKATETTPPLNDKPELAEGVASKESIFAKITKTVTLLPTIPTNPPVVPVVEETAVVVDAEVKVKEQGEQGQEGDTLTKKLNLTMLTKTTTFLKRPNKEEAPIAPVEESYEGIYIVLTPIEFKDAAGFTKMVREFRDVAELEGFILMQHWGIAVGEKYYHLHKNQDESLAVSLVPFPKENRTIKIPVWRTKIQHEDRAGMAIGVIKEMGALPNDNSVRVYETDEDTPLSDEEKLQRQYSTAVYKKSLVPIYFKGNYNPIVNNCIGFVFRFLFEQLIRFKYDASSGTFKAHLAWAVNKWRENGCKITTAKIAQKIMDLFGPAKMMRSMKRKMDNTQAAVKSKITRSAVKVGEDVKQEIVHPLVTILLSFMNIDVPGEKPADNVEEPGEANDDEVNVSKAVEEAVEEAEEGEEEEEEEEEVGVEEEEEEELVVGETPLPVTA